MFQQKTDAGLMYRKYKAMVFPSLSKGFIIFPEVA